MAGIRTQMSFRAAPFVAASVAASLAGVATVAFPSAAFAQAAGGDSKEPLNANAQAALAGAPQPAEAPTTSEDPAMRKIVSERRNGVVLGIAPGFALGGASGYPNSEKFIGNQDYYSSTPMLPGSSTSFFLMGAFTDYLSFGPMVNVSTLASDKWRTTGFGIGFRAEAFPLIRLFPKLADTAIYTQLGVGSAEVHAQGPYPSSDGTQSFVGVGLHHEFRLTRLLGGHASAGPFVEYDTVFSTPVERHWLSIGLRVAWYGGTVTADRR